MTQPRDFACAVEAMAEGECITVNALADQLDTDPRFARLVLLRAYARELIEPVDGLSRWQRTAP